MLAINSSHCMELCQVGVLVPLVQILTQSQSSEAGHVAAVALCNLAQDPMCRRMIVRARVKLVRQRKGDAKLAGTSSRRLAADVSTTGVVPAGEWNILVGQEYVHGDTARDEGS